jgi:hypothetical protein
VPPAGPRPAAGQQRRGRVIPPVPRAGTRGFRAPEVLTRAPGVRLDTPISLAI